MSARRDLIEWTGYRASDVDRLNARLAAIEAEAVAAERARLRALVEGLESQPGRVEWDAALRPSTVVYLDRAAVLAALEEPDAR